MNWLRQTAVDIKVRLAALFRRGAMRARLDEEMRAHMEMRERRLVDSGYSPEDAKRRARREFGNAAILRDSAADMWRYGSVERLLQDTRYGLRTLARTPGLTCIAVSVLALGIALNTTIFTVINSYLLQPLPAAHPADLVRVCSNRFSATRQRTFLEYRSRNSTLDGLVAFNLTAVGLRIDGETEQAFGEIVSADYFSVLGIRPFAGRVLAPADDAPDAPPVVVVSHEFWRRRLGGRPDAIGRTLMLNDHAFTVVGVAAQGFPGMMSPLNGALWVPLGADSHLRPGLSEAARLDSRSLHLVGRLKPGVDRARAQSDLDTIGRQLRAAAGQTSRDQAVTVYAATMLHPEIMPPVAAFTSFLQVMVGLVLLIVCVNVANLLLARAATRGVELAIRQSIGAGRGRLVQQLLTESLLLSLGGVAGGVAITYWLTRALMAVPLAGPLPVAFHLSIDGRVLGFSAAVALVATLVFGTAPALGAARVDLLHVLKGVVGPDRRHGRIRARFLIAQVSMSVLLLVTAGLFMLAVRASQAIDRGFESSHVLTASVDLEARGYSPARGREFVQTLTDKLRHAPGVAAANVVDILPLTLSNSIGFFLRDGDPLPSPDRPPRTPQVFLNGVGSGHFETLRIAMLEGRDFTDRDTDDSPRVAIVNETLARHWWPGRSALGQRLRPAGAPDDARAAIEIVGVVRDSKYVTVGEESRPFLYRPLSQAYTSQLTMLVRAFGAPMSVRPAIVEVVRGLDPGLPVYNVVTMEDATIVSTMPARIAGWLLTGLGLLALVLSGLGTYGVLAYLVRARARELAIRLAIGSTPRAVAMIVVRHALQWTLVGSAIGLGAALALTRLLAGYLYGVSPTNPMVLGCVVLLILSVSGLAALLPALRAARQDPLATLREA